MTRMRGLRPGAITLNLSPATIGINDPNEGIETVMGIFIPIIDVHK